MYVKEMLKKTSDFFTEVIKDRKKLYREKEAAFLDQKYLLRKSCGYYTAYLKLLHIWLRYGWETNSCVAMSGEKRA